MGCGGCEAKLVKELYTDANGNAASAPVNSQGGYLRGQTQVQIELTEPGGGIMDTFLTASGSILTNGACDANCGQAQSCSVLMMFMLRFLAIMPDPSGAGPDPNFGPILTFTPPAGGTVNGGATIDISPQSRVQNITVRDDEEGTVGSVSYIVDYKVEMTFTPGCGNTASYVIGFANFALDPATGWSRVNPVQDSPTFEIGCEPCKASKRVRELLQSDGKNAVADIESRE